MTITFPADFATDITQEEIDQQSRTARSTASDQRGWQRHLCDEQRPAQGYRGRYLRIHPVHAGWYGWHRGLSQLTAIDHNEDYTNFTVTTTTKPGETAISDSMSVLIFATCGQTYGIVSGDIPENIHVDFVNADSGELVTSWDSENMAE